MDDRQVRYCVYNQTRESFLSFNVARAASRLARWNALLGKFRMRSDEGIWLIHSQLVHTFGLWCSIDAIYLDAECRVTGLVEHLSPFRFGPLRRGNASVLVLPEHTIYASVTRQGDKLLIALPEEMNLRGSAAQ